MRKIIILLLLIVNFGLSQDINSKLYEKILKGIFPSAEEISIYVTDEEEKFNFKSNIKIVRVIENSNLILLNSENYNKKFKNKILFVSSYKNLIKYENAIGALYWKKGRPQIIFLKDRLKKYGLEIEPYLSKYIE